MPKRKLVGVLVLTIVLAVLMSPRFQALNAFPAQLRVIVGDQQQLSLDLPFNLYARCDREGVLGLNGTALGTGAMRVSLASPLVLETLGPGRATIEFRLFNLIPFKRVAVEVIPEIEVMPGGQSIGVLLQPDGVVVVGLSPVVDVSGRAHNPARDAGVLVGDLITQLNGQQVASEAEIAAVVEREGQAGRPVTLEIRRDGTVLRIEVHPVISRETGRYRLGILVRNMTAGVGTLTFYDPKTMVYTALGHVISDAASGQAANVRSGCIVQAFVSKIEPGKRGEPGEKMGSFVEGRGVLGDIRSNGSTGIYGVLSLNPQGSLFAEPVAIALAKDVHIGAAEIITVLEGAVLERFKVEIRKVYNQVRPASKGLVIEVTDPRLLARTGGIVQGMSGSPILQDGKLVGAVTHVFVNDPTKGYGIFAEWMAAEAGLLSGQAQGIGRLPAGLKAAFKTGL
jgi:stage IV sporulation protein B